MSNYNYVENSKKYLLQVIKRYSLFSDRERRQRHKKLCLSHLKRFKGISEIQIEIMSQVLAEGIKKDFLFSRIEVLGENTMLFYRHKQGYQNQKPFRLEIIYFPEKDVFISNIRDNVTDEIIESDMNGYSDSFHYLVQIMKEQEEAKELSTVTASSKHRHKLNQ